MKCFRATILFCLSLGVIGGGFGQTSLQLSTIKGPDALLDAVRPLLVEAYSQLGITPTFYEISGAGGLIRANQGGLDGEAYRKAGLNVDYPYLLQVPTPVVYVEFTAYSLQPDLKVTCWDDLKPFSVGFLKGVVIVEQHLVGFSSVPVASIPQSFKMLEDGRVDVVVAPTATEKQMRDLGMTRFFRLPVVLERQPLYHYLNAKYAGLVPRLDAVLQQMAKSGRLKFYQDLADGLID